MTHARNPLLDEKPAASAQLLERARAMLPSLVAEGVYLVNANGVIVDCNEAMRDISGYSLEELIGRTPAIFHSGVHDRTFYDSFWLELTGTGRWNGTVWNRRKNGEVYRQQLRIQAVRAPDAGAVIGYQAAAFELSASGMEKRAFDAPVAHERSSFMADLRATLLSSPDMHTAVCIVDLDRFTDINAQHGYEKGDLLLSQIARRLRDGLRSHDAVTRFSGDEYAFFLSGMSDLAEIDTAIKRIHTALQKPYVVDGQTIELTACIGTAVYPYDRGGSSAMMRAAAHALIAAKAAGPGQVRQFLSQPNEDTPGARICAKVEEGVHEGQMRLYYQPKVDMVSGEVVGFEALLRWQHPERGLIAPDEFLKRVRSQRVLMSIGEWAIEHVLGQIDAWRRRHGVQVHVSVNLVAEQFASAGFARRLSEIAERYPDVPLSCLEIEIVDAAALRNFLDARSEMCACRDLGVTFAVDDLGDPEGDDAILDGLPIQVLKVDHFFVEGMRDNPSDRVVVEKTIEVGIRRSRRVIAEGVETEAAGVELLRMGCRHAQGFFIARPMPADEVMHWMATWRAPDSWRAIQET